MKKKKEKDTTTGRMLLVAVMLVCLTISMITYWMYAYKNKYGNINISNRIVSYKTSDYITTKGNILYLKNVNKDIINKFRSKQEEIINNNNIIDNTFTSNIYKDILSIKITYIIQDKTTYEKILTYNIDLKQNKELTNDELLKITKVTYKDIATNIYNEYIKLPTDYNKQIIDAITSEELTKEEFDNNKEKYIIRIREKLPDIISLYIEDKKVYYMLPKEEIYKVCYQKEIDKSYIKEYLADL